MITPESVRHAYELALPQWHSLEQEAEAKFASITSRFPSVVYTSRIKHPESVLLKLEKGEYSTPFLQMDDFFACTLTIPSLTLTKAIQDAVGELFVVVPPRTQRDTPPPESFSYADHHLYLRLADDPLLIDKTLLNLVFELQIKTLLQDAWSRAGHSVAYKPKRLSWTIMRVSSELRALLEMADNMLADIEKVASMRGIVSYPKYDATNRVIQLLEKGWSPIELPEDRRRAANIVEEYLKFCGATVVDLENLLADKKYKTYLALKSLTPTQIVFVILYLEKMRGALNKFKPNGRKFLITSEMLAVCPELSRIPNDSRVKIPS